MTLVGERIRVVIAGGGTGGHVFPAIALADQLRSSVPESEVLFVGSAGGLEEKLVPPRGYALHLLHVGKLRGTGRLAQLRTLATLPQAGLAALTLLRRFSPHVVVGVGGYASGPVVLAAAVLRRPIILLEQNSIPGSTNRLLAHLADRVVVSFRRTARYLPTGRAVLLGNPLRPELLDGLRPPSTTTSESKAGEEPWSPNPGERWVTTDEASTSPAADGASGPCLVVLGGSQGAHALNELVTAVAPALAARLPGLRVVHQTGEADQRWVEERYQASGLPARVESFIENMGAVYREADLVLGRSGATTVAELCAAGRPAVLVPYPHAVDDHQAENAVEVAEAGGAVMERQEDLSTERLRELLVSLLTDRETLSRMGAAMRALARPEAAASIVELMLELTVRRRPVSRDRDAEENPS